MNKFLYARLRAGISAILMMFGVSATSAPQTTTSGATGKAGIHPWLDVGACVEADVLIDGQLMAQMQYLAEASGLQRRPAIVFDLPIGLKHLRLTGRLISPDAKVIPFDRTWAVHDCASVSAPLYDRSLQWIERVRGLQESTGGVTVADYNEEQRTAADKAFAALEKQLDRALPAPLRELGKAHITVWEYSYFLPLTEMTTVTQMLLGEWDYEETGEDGLDEILSPEVRARYDRSLMVFIETGDGLGGLAWDPTPDDLDGADQGVWFWLHQDDIDSPDLLLDEDNHPRDAEAAMSNALQRFGLSDEEDNIGSHEKELLVDTAHPRNLLQLNFTDDKPRLWMRSYDYHYSLY